MADEQDRPSSVPEQLATISDADAVRPRTKIGQFRILQHCGSGGMGEVFEAEQEEPVRRRVALKLIKLGMDSKEVLARFEAERQALALMNHTNIAHVFGAGTTTDGRPYFTMEFVRGTPITDYCDRARSTVVERLELFMQVCDGIQHAHQKGIIHRDIKPSNVLVAVQDGRPVPKIIDFGIAKATARRLTPTTLYTQMGQIVGTPEYMSPEQAELGRIDVDTRTDVYSLGVLAYELLTGALPFDTEDRRRAGFAEFQRRVREEPPIWPSRRVGDARQIARKRRTDPRSLARRMRGDLDWILLRALEKDPVRRYASASELAADMRRFLKDEPVTASPPSRTYRVRKFVRRHKAGVVFATVLPVLLAAFSITTALQNRRIGLEVEHGRTVSALLMDTLRILDTHSTPFSKRKERLDDVVGRIRTDLAQHPPRQVELMYALASIYSSDYSTEALELAQDAIDIAADLPGEPSAAVADNLLLVGNLLRWREGHQHEALGHYQRAAEIRERIFGADSREVAACYNNIGNLYWVMGRDAEALAAADRAVTIRRGLLPEDDLELGLSYYNLAFMRIESGDFDGAEPKIERALQIFRDKLDGDPRLASGLRLRANLHVALGQHVEARPLFAEALRIHEELEDPDGIAEAHGDLAILSALEADAARADASHRQAMHHYGLGGSREESILLYRARYRSALGDRAAALSLLRQAVSTSVSFRRIWNDPALAPLSEDPEFESIVGQVRASRI